MPKNKSSDLHGSAPDQSSVVLLLVDTISDMEFDGGEELFQHALPAARNIARLKKRAKAAGIPVVYVNDNYGRWQSDLMKIVEHASSKGVRGRAIAELLRPEEDDYFVLKPKNSAFFSTTLAILLEHLGARTLILTGVDGNICILYTAGDAHMRDYRVVVPSDCIASKSVEVNRWALDQMRTAVDADTTASDELDLNRLLAESAED
ncbi:MAG TPA: isochorismatase family cysteine hydrolase [Longimicrobiaceae bacterium]|nr:isochorismatase family cysteine hydrolase [Longimicrobiaceae bacterium]